MRMCVHKERERERECVTHTNTHTHTHTHGLSPYNTLATSVFLNVVILNRCKQWQEA